MSRVRRFFSEDPIEGASATLRGAEAHHLLNVVRLRIGEEAELFDGSGFDFRARLARAGRREAAFEVLDRRPGPHEPGTAVCVASAVPRGPRAEFLVEKCCELGAAEFVPLWCARSVADPRVRAENRLAKWRRLVIETSKQCGRSRLMVVRPPTDAQGIANAAASWDAAWICLPGAGAGPGSAGQRTLVVVGPEGGFTDEEEALALRAGMRPMGLGPTVLRVETAAVAALVRAMGA